MPSYRLTGNDVFPPKPGDTYGTMQRFSIEFTAANDTRALRRVELFRGQSKWVGTRLVKITVPERTARIPLKK